MSLPALAQASFTDVAASAGVDDDGLSVSAAWGDYDGDGDLDLYIIDGRGTANPQGRRILYRNEGDGTFTDVAPDAGVGIDGGNGASALWGDYDSDGDLDLYVFCSANVAADAVNRLFRNDGDGTFSEIAASAGVADEDYSPGGSWVDHDNDGDLDLHVVSGYQVSGPRTADRLYRNEGDGTFVDVAPAAGIDDSDQGASAVWGDYDDDGDLDCYLVKGGGDLDPVNKLFQNAGNGTFSNAANAAGVDDGSNSRTAVWGDYDNDGDLDLYLTTLPVPYAAENRLYRNEGDGTFLDVAPQAGVDVTGYSNIAAWVDYDNDTDLDLFIAMENITPDRLYQNQGDETFVSVGGVEGGSWGITGAWGDYDGDGDLDLYTTEYNGSPSLSKNFLYRNDGNANHWLTVELIAMEANNLGVGAELIAFTGATEQRRDVEGGLAFATQNSLPVEFGLGSATLVDALTVSWPSGTEQVITGLTADQFLTVEEILEDDFSDGDYTQDPVWYPARHSSSQGGVTLRIDDGPQNYGVDLDKGLLLQAGWSTEAFALTGQPTWRNVAIEADAIPYDNTYRGLIGAGLTVRAERNGEFCDRHVTFHIADNKEGGNDYAWLSAAWAGHDLGSGAGVDTQFTATDTTIQQGKSYRLKLEAIGSVYTAYIDGEQVLQLTFDHSEFATGMVGVGYVGGSESAYFDNISVHPPRLDVAVSVPDTTATYGEVVQIPVRIENAVGKGIVSAEVFLSYDSSLLTFDQVITGQTLTDGWTVEDNLEDGTGTAKMLKIAAADEVELSADGTLLKVQFTVEDVRVPASSSLTLMHVLLNDGNPENVRTDGSVTLVGTDGTIVTDVVEIIPREPITVTVTDIDENLDDTETDDISVEVENVTNGDVLTLTVDETELDSGIFISDPVATEFGLAKIDGDVIIQAQHGDVIEFRFVDELDGSGNDTTLVAQVTAKGLTDGAIKVTAVTQPGDQIRIRVIDPDLNLNSGAEETVIVTAVNSRTSESMDVTLAEKTVDNAVFFGKLPTTSGASTATEMGTAKGDTVTVTYDDVVTALGDQVDRTDTAKVIDPFGDADGNRPVQAYDAARVLLHRLSTMLDPPGPPLLVDLDSLSANVDTDAPYGIIDGYDASLILRRVVGLQPIFPVQEKESANHPQPESGDAASKSIPEERVLSLRIGEGYVSLWVEDLSGILSGEVVLEGVVGRMELGEELADFLSASGSDEKRTQVLFAGAESVSGPGELLRIYSGVGPGTVRLTRAVFNDGSVVGIAAEVATAAPVSFVLHANTPNPFNPETMIRYELPTEAEVHLEVFDVLGQRVRTLAVGVRSAGAHEVIWNGRSDEGAKVGNGVYLCRLQAGGFAQVRRMLLLK